MNLIVLAGLPWLVVTLFVLLGAWIGFQLIHQNGRLLSKLEELELRSTPSAVDPPAAAGMDPALALPDPIYGRILMRLEAIEQRLSPGAPAAAAPPASPPPGLDLGSPAPTFELRDLAGQRRKLSDFRGPRLLLFFNPGCGFCTQIAADLAALPTDGAGGRPLPIVVTTGGVEANRKLVQEHGIRCPILLQEGMEVASRYQANGTPMGYLIDAQGNIASELAIGGPSLLALAQSAPENNGAAAGGPGAAALGGKRTVEESKLQRNGLAAGTPAPDFSLPLLYGGELSLSDYRGRQVLLVFSDPQCGPCDALAPQLEQAARRTAGVQVLVLSRGDEEANRVKASEHGLTIPVVLQRQWEISREYGMFATPIAYLIDPEGTIAREVAVGVEPILDLLSTAAGASADPSGPRRCPCGKPVGECGCGKKAKARAAGAHRNGR